MRLQHQYFLIGLVLLLCSQATLAIRPPVVIRQDGTASASSQSPATTDVQSSSEPSGTASSKNNPSGTSTATHVSSQTKADTSATATPSVAATATSGTQASTTSSTAEASSSSNPDANVLPIQPKITPAMGLTGAILLISGAVYAVIGIKTKWLYVFFSAAYLAGLAVAVLIIYLMNPPVSDAVQGAFFVAAFFTGIIFGAISLVFPDITEGLGCLLGGFCLSMWFLTLKEGGLITSTTGRGIFIGVMSVAGFSLSFSHYTRTYGLIVCIAFGGATITMLGVDCFSCAGWKEFWLYLWNLNTNTFPLNTNTYPLTRGIKVEIACTILLSALGIVSQLKLWKVVKERREKNAAQRLQRDEDSKREEEELGRRIENDMSRERARWEAAYGNKTAQQDSVMEVSEKSTPKTSMSVQEQEISPTESIEMMPLPQNSAGGVRGIPRSTSKHASTSPAVTVTVLPEDDEIHQIDEHGNAVPSQTRALLSSEDVLTNANNSARTSTEMGGSGSSNLHHTGSTRSSIRSSLPPPPAVVPLPFQIPQEVDENDTEADHASVSAVPESVHDLPVNHRPLSKRTSGGSMLKRLSAHKDFDGEPEYEALIIPHIEEDRASSLAATLDEEDDVISLAEASAPRSPLQLGFDVGIADGNDSLGELTLEPNEAGNAVGATSIDTTKPSVRQSLTVSTDPLPNAARAHRVSLNSPRHVSETMSSVPEGAEAETSRTPKSRSGAPSVNSQSGSPIGLSPDALPKNLSKVAMSYRTNEWAKHLEVAERPDLEDMDEPGSPGIQISHDVDERPAPVSDEILGKRPKLGNRKSKRTSAGSAAYRNSSVIRSTSNMSRQSSAEPQQTSNVIKRTSSTPWPLLNQDSAGSRLSDVPSPLPSHTLMGERDSRVRNKITSQSFTPQQSSANLIAEVDPEDLTLAQRKQLIQQQKAPSTSQQWRRSNSAAEKNPLVYDSHQPRRSSGGFDSNERRETMLANWREGMRQSSAGATGPKTKSPIDDSKRMALVNEKLLNQKRQKEMAAQQKAMEKQQRESMMDQVMRGGGMQDAHREALRRMQAKADRHAS